MIDFTKESKSFRGADKCKINMKNEFYMSRIMLTDAKKHYALKVSGLGNYSIADGCFYEITEDSAYQRVPLSFHSILSRDEDNGKVTAKFTAELDVDNIINNIPINQIAIVDSSEKNDASTTFFAAAVTEDFTKSEKLALVFVIEITI